MPLTRTYYDLIPADVASVTFHRGTASSTGWYVSANATIRAEDGKSLQAAITREATESQRTQIETFITNHVVGALNTQEKLV